MAEITSIKPQRRKERFNIFIDGVFAFGVNSENLIKNKMKIGKKITEAEIKKIGKDETYKKLLERGLNFLSYRQRTIHEMKVYLSKKLSTIENVKFNEALESKLVETIVNKLISLKLLNDKEFTVTFIESKTKYSKKGLRLVKLELIKKGVDKDIISELLEGKEDDVNIAFKAVEKKLKSWQKLEKWQLKRKVYELLTRRGFDFEICEKVFAKVAEKR